MEISIIYESRGVFFVTYEQTKSGKILGPLISDLSPKEIEFNRRSEFKFKFEDFEINGRLVCQFELPKFVREVLPEQAPVIICSKFMFNQDSLEIDWLARKAIYVNSLLKSISAEFRPMFVSVLLTLEEATGIWNQYFPEESYNEAKFTEFVTNKLCCITNIVKITWAEEKAKETVLCESLS